MAYIFGENAEYSFPIRRCNRIVFLHEPANKVQYVLIRHFLLGKCRSDIHNRNLLVQIHTRVCCLTQFTRFSAVSQVNPCAIVVHRREWLSRNGTNLAGNNLGVTGKEDCAHRGGTTNQLVLEAPELVAHHPIDVFRIRAESLESFALVLAEWVFLAFFRLR